MSKDNGKSVEAYYRSLIRRKRKKISFKRRTRTYDEYYEDFKEVTR